MNTTWCLLDTFEPSDEILDGSDLEREKKKREGVRMRGEKGFQSRLSKSVLNNLNVPSGYDVGYNHVPALKNSSSCYNQQIFDITTHVKTKVLIAMWSLKMLLLVGKGKSVVPCNAQSHSLKIFRVQILK